MERCRPFHIQDKGESVRDQLDTRGRKKNFSAERRRALSERMKALWTDAEFCAKRAEASRRAIKDKWANNREEALAQMQFNMQYSPKRCEYARTRLQDAARMERHQELLAHLNSDPAIREKRMSGLKKKWADPEYRKKMSQAYDKRRGFRIPPQKRAEYDFLRISKKCTAREAGQMLGLI